MTTGTFTQPDYTLQSAAAYKANIDAGFRVFSRSGNWFSAHQQDQGSPAPEMSVRIDAGALFDGTTFDPKDPEAYASGFAVKNLKG